MKHQIIKLVAFKLVLAVVVVVLLAYDGRLTPAAETKADESSSAPYKPYSEQQEMTTSELETRLEVAETEIAHLKKMLDIHNENEQRRARAIDTLVILLIALAAGVLGVFTVLSVVRKYAR